MNRGPVYNTHCKTWRVACNFAGNSPDVLRVDLAAAIDDTSTAPALFSFRALPQFRSIAAKQLRREVAAFMRESRGRR